MRRIVSPSEFALVFAGVVSDGESLIKAKWHGSQGPYTAVMCGNEGGVIPQVCEKLKLELTTEPRLTVDALFCDSNIPVVGIEHENDVSGSANEIKKLSLLNLPLKVLITYPWANHSETEVLGWYTEPLRLRDFANDFATTRRQLVIFGSEKGKRVKWSYYTWESPGFAVLNV